MPDDDGEDPVAPERLGFVQRSALRRLRKAAGRADGEPLAAEDWAVLWELEHSLTNRFTHRVWRALPADPRCQMCAAPFAGVGRFATRALGFRPSRKNPNMCSMCISQIMILFFLSTQFQKRVFCMTALPTCPL